MLEIDAGRIFVPPKGSTDFGGKLPAGNVR
jgi:hypothetical protein